MVLEGVLWPVGFCFHKAGWPFFSLLGDILWVPTAYHMKKKRYTIYSPWAGASWKFEPPSPSHPRVPYFHKAAVLGL
jgi:hypothetical protein